MVILMKNKIKKKFAELLIFFKKMISEFLLKKNCLVCMNIFKVGKCKVVFLDTLEAIKVYRDETTSDIYRPAIGGIENSHIKVDVPAVKMYLLSDVVITTKSSNFIAKNSVIIERIPSIALEYCNYATGAILTHDSQVALCKNMRYKLNDIDNAIFLGGNGSWNYYHWMTEILPKIEFLEKYNAFDLTANLIVSDVVKTTDSFIKTLNEALKNVKVNLLFLDSNRFYKVKNLYVVSSPSNVLFNSKKIATSPNYNFFRKQSLDYVRDLVFIMIKKYNQVKLITILSTLKNKYGKINIFLARKRGSAREYNQQDVWNLILKETDAKKIYIEDYSIEEQAFIFSKADLIIGPSGAAWTNLIFCKENTFAISWLPVHLKDFSVYSTLAQYYGVKNYFIECYSVNTKEIHVEYTVPLDLLKAQLEKVNLNEE